MSGVGDLAERIERFARSAGLFPEPGLALVAVSGGPDSVALLDIMVRLAPEFGLDLEVAHVDHGIGEDSADVARTVTETARRYDLELHERKLHLGPATSETQARDARYVALREMQSETGARYLVVAHHADDQLETVLYRFLRGTGIAGLAGMPAVGENGLVRPLLEVTRGELAEWLKLRESETGEPFAVHVDPANADERHDRSWLRTRVIPLLRERFGSALGDRLADVRQHAASERRAWSALLRELPELDYRADHGAFEVARTPLQKYDKTLSEAILRALAREAGVLLGPRRSERLLSFVRESVSGKRVELGGGWVVEIAFDRVRLIPARSPSAAPATIAAREETGTLRWGGWHLRWSAESAGSLQRRSWTTWVTPGPAVVRAPLSGDRLLPLGGVGRRKVRRLLMEARVPSRERAGYPLLTRNGDVLWIPGVCRAEAALPRSGEPAVRIEVARQD